MFTNETRKLRLENRLARLATNTKDNFPVQKKIMRKLKNI